MPLRHDVINAAEWVRRASVFRFAGIVEIYLACSRIIDYVFEDCAKHSRSTINVRLRFGRELDHLGIAAALEIEDAVVGPSVFIITDQAAFGIGGKCGFSGS